MSLQQPLGGGGGQDDVGAQQLLLLLVERLQGGEAGEGTQVGEGEWMISGHPQVTRHVLVITAVTILEQKQSASLIRTESNSLQHLSSSPGIARTSNTCQTKDIQIIFQIFLQPHSPACLSPRHEVLISQRCLALQLLPASHPVVLRFCWLGSALSDK